MIDQQRLDKIKLWSEDPNAYASLQPGLQYFDHPLGYIAYRRVLSGNVILGDPICEPENLVNLLADFLKAYPNSVFNYLSETAAHALLQASKKQMNFIHILFERYIDLPYLPPYSKSILGALKKATKANLRLMEKNLSELNVEELMQVKSISNTFVEQSHAGNDIGFISRTMSFSPEPGVRFFLIYAGSDSIPIGFCTLDPWYKDKKLIRYQLNQFRLAPTKIWGIYLSVVSMLAKMLHMEGVVNLSLGACCDFTSGPFSNLPASKLYTICRIPALRLTDSFYGVKNFSKNKFEFSGTNINRYIAAPHRIPLTPLLRVARAFT